MSSVNSASDRSMAEEAMRAQREQFQKREADAAKNQAHQLKQIGEAHRAEIEGLKEGQAEQLQDINAKTRESLTRQDLRHQKEINELRELHQKALAKTTNDTETNHVQAEKALREEAERVKHTSEQQRNRVTKAYEDQLRDRDSKFEEFATDFRKTEQESNKATKKKFANVNDEQMKALTEDTESRIQNLQTADETFRKNAESQYKVLEHKKDIDEDRLVHNSESALQQERDNNTAAQDEKSKDLKLAVREAKDRYEKAADVNRRDMEAAREKMESNISSRAGEKTRALNDDIGTLRATQARSELRAKQETAREVRDIRDNMQANIDQLELERGKIVDSAHAKYSEEIAEMAKKDASVLAQSNKFFENKIADDQARNTERFDQQSLDNEKTVSKEKVSGDSRLNKLKAFSEVEQEKLRSYFERATGSMKENFEASLRELRDRNQKEKQQLFTQFAHTSQDNDAKFQQKLGEVSAHYEKQINDLQLSQQKELKDQAAAAEKQKADIAKKSDLDLKTQASQYQYHLAKIEETHAKQIEDLRRKHEESLANLVKNRQA